MSAAAALLPDGRLHLQHGPIDCICRAWGEADAVRDAYMAAAETFPAILPELCAELPVLRRPLPSLPPHGDVARAMHAACLPFARRFITPMAAVAGAVADHVLRAMTRAAPLARAFVNNGGDIAFHLAPGETLACGLVPDLAAPALAGRLTLHAAQPSRGLATSGRACKERGGRSFSLGIADAVTVLARDAAAADAAATVIANAVDLPGHPAILRRPAREIDPDSDLGEMPVTWDLAALAGAEVAAALDAGRLVADALRRSGLIAAAALMLRGAVVLSAEPTIGLAVAGAEE
jgi:ApbE superfamily uncharacterized protein (UPF0280 family)